jgi:threonine aldolase
MPEEVIDLRSDTVTRPSRGMRAAIADAEVGDDVLGDDPTVLRLQERMADLLGKEAALFVPSGSMANMVAIRAACEPGDEIICDINTHSYNYEGGGPAALSGCSMRLIDGQRGVFTGADVERMLRPKDAHFPRSKFVIIENTNNRGGGTVWPLATFEGVTRTARQHGLHVHLDGARLMNACIAAGLRATDYCAHVDSVSTCFSKGLGAPVGSVVAGSRPFVDRTHRFRKMFGGGMRQAGVLAAAALYALDHNVERLAEDHANARHLAEGLAEMPGLQLDLAQVETNIVYFDVAEAYGGAAALAQALAARGVHVLTTGPWRIRAVTHLDVSRAQIERALAVFADVTSATTVTG